MSSVNYVNSNSDYLAMDKGREPSQDMGKDAFMQLLVTQRQYQDPLNPMDNQEMMAQLAQFTALEQMMNVANTVQKQLVHGRIGNFVQYQYTDPDTGKISYELGKVDYIKKNGSEALLGIENHEIKAEHVKQVIDKDNIQSNSSAFELLGKTVQALIESTDSTTGEKQKTIIEGEVLSVNMKDEKPYVVIGTGNSQVEIALEQVQNIVENPTLTGRNVRGIIIDDQGNEVEVEGIVEYIAMQKDNTYLYVDGQFILFENLKSVDK